MPFDGTAFEGRITAREVEVLRKARAHIARDDGWSQWAMSEVGGRYCALGALVYLSGPLRKGSLDRGLALAAKALLPVMESGSKWQTWNHPIKPHAAWAISVFNDSHRTTKDDVLALFDRGIARAEALVRLRRSQFPTRMERLSDRLLGLLQLFHGSTNTNAPLSAVFAAADQNNSNTRSLA